MIKPEEYKQLKAYTRQDGFIMGLIWIASFACLVNFTTNIALSLLFDIIIIAIPVVMYFMVRRYRDKIINSTLSFRRGFAYSMFVCMYAMLLLCAAQWVYFQFMDNGFFFGSLQELFNSKQYADLLNVSNIPINEMNAAINDMMVARPIDIAFSWLGSSLWMSILMSLGIGLVTRKSKI